MSDPDLIPLGRQHLVCLATSPNANIREMYQELLLKAIAARDDARVNDLVSAVPTLAHLKDIPCSTTPLGVAITTNQPQIT